jgi:tetratricopeptide (TPR) repeat protein
VKNNLFSIDEYRNNPEFYFYKGLRYASKRNLSDAYKNLVKASRLNPENCEYKFNIACFLSEMQRPKEANRIFNDILLHYDPTMYDCYFGMGCNCFELGDMEKAAEYFEKYIYFDSEGEFSEEVTEMIFYLKLYNDISADNRFLRLSRTNLKRAEKSLSQDRNDDAVRELYKSVAYNPMNVEARNLLALVMLEQQNYKRAGDIISTVNNIFGEDIWANCLSIYNLYHARKYSRVEKFLKILPFRKIYNREDLLCVATTLVIFNKIEELILLLETYIVEHSDIFIYSILLLGYVLTEKTEKAHELFRIISSMNVGNKAFTCWITRLQRVLTRKENPISVVDEYKEIFSVVDEPEDNMYSPYRYIRIYKNKPCPNFKLSNRYNSIVDCTVLHREIMYNSFYEKEIIQLLSSIVKHAKEPLQECEEETVALSAALEYIYCKESFIDMDKEELIQKYEIPSIKFNKALKKLSSIHIKNVISKKQE